MPTSPGNRIGTRHRAVDLFAGAGGATAGMKRAGLEVVAAVELDADACATYRRNHSDVELVEGDIREVDPAELARGAGFRRGQLALLKACAPCQGFSTLGLSDSSDDRNDLVLETWRFIRVWHPRSFVFENVVGIRDDPRLEQVIRQARAIGYGVNTYVVDATDFGVPQRRRRHIVIGVLGVSKSEFPETLPTRQSRAQKRTVAAAIAGLATRRDDPLNRFRKSRPRTRGRIEAIPIGGSRLDLPAEHILKCHKALTKSGALGPYSRMRANEPAPTLTTRCTTPSCGQFVHPTKHRGLTLREAAVLQTFPLNYDFVGGYDSIERQIGNAVPVLMAAAVCRQALRLMPS